MIKNYFVYVLYCADNTLYCGYTDNVSRRLVAHNTGKGAKYTKARLPVKLLTSVTFSEKEMALKCEWWFKHKLTKSEKMNLIQTNKIKTEFKNYMKKRT